MSVGGASRFLYRIVQASSSACPGVAAATAATSLHCSSGAKGSSSDPVASRGVKPSSMEDNGVNSSANAPPATGGAGTKEESDSSGREQDPSSKRPKLDACSSSDHQDCNVPSETVEPGGNEGADKTRRIRGVIFDMDGTLTVPVLNFVEMRRELKIPVGMDILPTVLGMPPAEQEAAMKIIEKWEEEGARKLQLQPGTIELLEYVAESNVRRALMTRNSMVQTRVFLDRISQQLTEKPDKYPHLSKGPVFEEVSVWEIQHFFQKNS